MAKKISNAGVGAFVLCAVLLMVLALVALGGKSLLSANNEEYILYFDGSVNGLSIGAPVVFRGVPMGSVSKISLVPNRKEGRGILISVRVRLSPDAFSGRVSQESVPLSIRHRIFKNMVENGLRAQLQLNSLITGQYRIDFDFYPATTPTYYSSNRDMEIPTIPSPLDTLSRTLENLPVKDITETLSRSLTALNSMLKNEDLQASLKALRTLLEESTSLISSVRGSINTSSKELPQTIVAFRTAMNDMSAAAKSLEAAMNNTRDLTATNSPTVRKIHQSLQEFNSAARAMRELANTLERHPESLILGKGGSRP
ncbi:MAG: MlaD family protein [Desulfovibrionaceae bacterium]|nr:MlaD family protein [Desulfovibrionaceae bacterium]